MFVCTKSLSRGLAFACSCVLALLTVQAVFPNSASAQSTPGFPPFATLQSSPYETIKINDGSVLLSLPVRTKAGLIPFSYSLVSNLVASVNSLNQVQIIQTFGPQTSVGLSPSDFIGGQSSSSVLCPDGIHNTIETKGYVFVDGFGTVHNFSHVQTDSLKCLTNDILQGGDGSGYTLSINQDGTNPLVFDRQGGQLSLSNPVTRTFTDTNGNQLSSTWCSINCTGNSTQTYTYTDPTGVASPMVETITFSGNLETQDAHAWTDAAGNPQSFTVNYSNYTQRTHFGCADMLDIGPKTQALKETFSPRAA